MPAIVVPEHLSRACETPEQQAWLEALPATAARLARAWSLAPGPPLTENATCSWVAPCGPEAILKIGMPHFEGRDEIAGLRFWDGEPTVRLLAWDEAANAMLLERCVPGTPLARLDPEAQERVLSAMLPRLWRSAPPGRFRRLTEMIGAWNLEVEEGAARYPDPALARHGAAMRAELAASAPVEVTLGTDIHAGNVLAAGSGRWRVIDPKPFVGDPAYDATQHLLNHIEDLTPARIDRFAERLGTGSARLRRWTFARLASELGGRYQHVARALEAAGCLT